MTFGITAAGVMTAAKVGMAGYSIYKGIKGGGGGGGEGFEMPEAPDYHEDANYRETQDYLKGYGMDILGGNIPSYYKAIGETGSPEFEDALGKSKRDVMQGTTEALAKGGRARGGQLGASTAQAIGDLSVNARYKDYERSLAGKESLLRTGVGITEGVRGAGQTEGSNVNKFNEGQYQMFSDNYWMGQDQQRLENEDKGSMIGNIGTIASGVLGSKLGQSALGKIGSLFGKSGASSSGTTPSGYSGSKVGFDEWGYPMSIA